MTHNEADRAMLLQAPVTYRGQKYKQISGLIYRKDGKSGGGIVVGELLSGCGHSVTIARLDKVDWLRPEDRERPARMSGPEEQEQVYHELQARKAFWNGAELWHEEERWKVSALILRKWLERPYWVTLELCRVSDGLVQEVWSGSIVFAKPEEKEKPLRA